MRAAVRRALSIALCCALLNGCYLAHERTSSGIDAASGDVLLPDASSDAVTHVDVGPTCDGRGMIWGMPCTPELDAECQRRATMQAYGRPAYSRCFTLANGRQSSCTAGDTCIDGDCRCTSTRYCLLGEDVCVSDTPDGPHYCVPICAR